MFFSISAEVDGQHKEWVDSPFITDEEKADFLRTLKKGKKMDTAQPNARQFGGTYWSNIQNGTEQIASLVISKELSGTMTSAELGKSLSPKDLEPKKPGLSTVSFGEQANIIVADIKTASIGEGLVITQVEMENRRGDFKDATELVKRAEELSRNLYVAQAVPDLGFLRRGGRIGLADRMLGGIMGIIPIVGIDENGAIVPAEEKKRGWPRTREALINHVAGEVGDRAVRLALVYYDTDQFDNLRNDIRGRFKIAEDEFGKEYEIMLREQDMVTSVYGGPGIIGVAALVLGKRAA